MACVSTCMGNRNSDRQWGVSVPSQARGEFGAPLYHAGFEHSGPLAVPPDGSATAWECLQQSAQRNPNRQAVAQRRLIKVHQVEENGRTFEKLEMENSLSWLTYEQYFARVKNFASGLADLERAVRESCRPSGLAGLERAVEREVGMIHRPSDALRVVIYAETQMDWMVAALASFSRSMEVVTVYATLGEEGALVGFQQTKSPIVVADARLIKVLLKIADRLDYVKYVITITECDAASKQKLAQAGKTVMTFEEVIQQGIQKPVDPKPPSPTDVAVVMYTSGTTAAPKGVKITHGNLMAAVAGFHQVGPPLISRDSVYLAYLPLAHIMEMIGELSMIYFGAAMGYGSPHTLTESGVKLKRPESEGDAVIIKPTFMAFPPAVLDKIYKAITGKVDAKGGFAQWMFGTALNSGLRRYEKGEVGANSLLNKVFGNVQAMLGGRLQLALTGSAPLSPEIQKFLQVVLKCAVRQAYGLTENCACAAVGDPADNTVQSNGAPSACTVIRLADWPEGGYMNSDRDRAGIEMPRGEVLVGGPTVALGYLVDETNPDMEVQKKNETDFILIDGVRYFRSGDIGQITPNGQLQIIDRKKDLWKGPNGEYVALTKVEAALKLCPLVEIPMAYGKTGGGYPIALLCPNMSAIRKMAVEKGVTAANAEELCKNKVICDEVFKACVAACKSQKLVAFEIPEKVALIPGNENGPAWTPENDMLTAAMKLKRPVIARVFAKEINSCYTA